MRPHPLKYPTIHAVRNARAYTLARWHNLRPVIRPVARDAALAFAVSSLVWLALALPFQHYAAADWEKRVEFRGQLAALHGRAAQRMVTPELVYRVQYQPDFWSAMR